MINRFTECICRVAVVASHVFRANLLGRMGHTLKSREVVLWTFIEVGKSKNLLFLRHGLFAHDISQGNGFMKYAELIREFNNAESGFIDEDYPLVYFKSLLPPC